MPSLDDKINTEVKSLVESGMSILNKIQKLDSSLPANEVVDVSSWVTRLGQLIRRLYTESSEHYKSYTHALSTTNFYNLHSNWNTHFAQLVGVSKSIQHDITTGFLIDFKSIVQADIFADFLEMGEYLLQEGYKDAAAVIIGTVLEDTLRKLSERNGLPVANASGKPLTMEPLNVELAKQEVYSKLTQKQITSWAHIRNKAAHGEFDEYNAEQVQFMLLFVQGFASDSLK